MKESNDQAAIEAAGEDVPLEIDWSIEAIEAEEPPQDIVWDLEVTAAGEEHTEEGAPSINWDIDFEIVDEGKESPETPSTGTLPLFLTQREG